MKVGEGRAAPTPFNSLIYTHAGEITPQMVAWLSSIENKNLNNCGKFVLTGDMSQLSITKVDLSNMNTLEGTLGSRSVVCAARKEPSRKHSHPEGESSTTSQQTTHHNTPHRSILLGNIKDLPKSITNLNLWNCVSLEGR